MRLPASRAAASLCPQGTLPQPAQLGSPRPLHFGLASPAPRRLILLGNVLGQEAARSPAPSHNDSTLATIREHQLLDTTPNPTPPAPSVTPATEFSRLREPDSTLAASTRVTAAQLDS